MLTNDEVNQLIHSLETTPAFPVIESLYARSKDSPVFAAKSVARSYQDLFLKVEEVVLNSFVRSRSRRTRELPFTSLYAISEMITYLLPTHTSELLVEAMRPDYLDHYFPCHLLNVSILSCRLGMELKLKPKELTDLGVAALVHDLGMALLDSSLFTHERVFSENERRTIESHPVLGYEFLAKVQDDFPWLARVVLEEHKREDGSGYPAEGSGEIHPYSKIIGICDTFEALTHRRFHRKALHPADAMRIVLQARNTEYSPTIVKAMVEAFSLYPVGSFVYLNNEKVAKVIEPAPGNPLRPVVKLVGQEAHIIRLSKETHLYIAGIAHDETYKELKP